MSTSLVIFIIIVLLLILMYNTLISKKNQVENIFGSIDALLKKRYDLVPNIIASVQEYMHHEKSLLEEVTKLRGQATEADTEHETIALDAKMSSALGSIMVAVEDYPELKANENVMHLQATLNEIEEQISAARRAYNQAVTEYNNTIEMIPTNFMANAMKYTRKEVFEIPQTQRKNINVKELFNEQR